MDGEELTKPQKPKKTSTWRKLLKILLIFLVSLVGMTAIAAGISAYILYKKGLFEPPDFSKLEDRRETSIMYAEGGEKLREYCIYCREFATLQEMGNFPSFAIAVEDKKFATRLMPYDLKGIIRAFWHNYRAGKIVEGSSTISMQVARNVFEEKELKEEWETKSHKAKWWRKLKEAWLAVMLEKHFGRKDRMKILEIYLNIANCGSNIYGVKACSHYWFNKEPAEPNTAEAAWIMSLWRKPAFWRLIEGEKEEAIKLRGRVLQQLADEEKITTNQKDEFNKLPLPEKPEKRNPDPCQARHAAEFARLQILEKMDLVDQGLKVFTTINCEWQKTAGQALHESLEAMRARNQELTDLRGVAILIDRYTGGIKVFAQEPSFQESEYRIDQIQRHAGSAAKPFAALAYLLHGGKLSCKDAGTGPCKLNDSPVLSIYINPRAGRKHIQNFPYEGLKRYLGFAEPILCLAESRNACIMSMVKGVNGGLGVVSKDDITEVILRLKIKLPKISTQEAKRVGMLNEILADRLGISRYSLDPGHTVAIGSIDISAMEMVRAWSAFLGPMVEPRIINQVVDGSGEITTFPPKEPENVMETIWIESQKEILLAEEMKRLRKIYKHKPVIELYWMAKNTIDEEVLKKDAPKGAEKTQMALLRGLRSTIEFPHGTGKLARTGKFDEQTKTWIIPKLDFQVCGKTGTATNQQGETTDNWFIGCTPSYIMAVWIGRDQKLPLKVIITPEGKKIQETGGRNSLPVFIKTMKEVYKYIPKENFPETTDPNRPLTAVEKVPTTEIEESDEEEGW